MRVPTHLGTRRPAKDVTLKSEATDSRWYLACIALIVASIIFHQPLLIISGVLLLLVLGTTDLWAHYCLQDLHYQRSFSEQRALFGEEITFSLSIENAKLLPLPWLEVEETIPRALPITEQTLRSSAGKESAMLECLFSPSWYERITRNYTLRCNSRGVHAFGPVRLRSGDAFGFLNREMELNKRQFLLVYPLIVPLESFRLPSRHPFGERRTPRRLLEDPSRVIGVRDYAYGDSLRRVNWKATARTQKLQSKVYEETTTHTLAIFLNAVARSDVQYGIYPELQELAICATASVADWALTQGYAVGLHSNTSLYIPDEDLSSQDTPGQGPDWQTRLAEQLRRRRIHLPPANSEEQRKRIMETLARIQTFFGGNIEEVIASERAHLPIGATIVVITSTINEQLVDTLAQMKQRGSAVTILFVGNTSVPLRLAGITLYHLGGEETWRELQAGMSKEQSAGFKL